MKLSEAIRLGIPVVKEDRSLYLSSKGGDPCGCALGTAMYAIGKRMMIDTPEADVEWPWLGEHIESPMSGWVSTASRVISMLHYTHGWSREQIAAFVETIEPQDAQPTQEVTHEVLDQPAHTHHD